MDKKTTIMELLKLDALKLSDLIATKKGLLNHVESVTIMDFPNIVEWVQRKELLIIGYFMETHFDEPFIAKLAEYQVAGIITKKKFKKWITPEMIALLSQYDIPVVLVEDKFSWSEITTPIQSLIIKKHTTLLRDTEKFYQAIINSLSDHQFLNDLCSAVYNVADLSLAITDYKFNLLDYSFDFDWKEYLAPFSKPSVYSWSVVGKDNDHKIVEGFFYRNLKWPNQQVHILFVPIYQKQKIAFFILLKIPVYRKEISVDTIAKLQSIQSIYLLKMTFYREFQKANLHYRNLFFENLLTIKNKKEANRKQISLVLGNHLELSYRMVLLKNTTIPSTDLLDEKNEQFLDFWRNFYLEEFVNENILLFSKDDYFIFLVGDSQHSIEDFIEKLETFFISFSKSDVFKIGVSELHPYWCLSSAWKEAEQAIFFMEKNSKDKRVQFYKNLGILKIFTDDFGKINQYFLQQMLNDYIQPIIDVDQKRNADLLKTLETFFANGFAHNQTANVLFIHKNTLRSRLKIIEETLQINLKNSDDLMNLHLALRINQMLPDSNE
ncbi:PucR family transcriptional regulator [Isobaculum melis]|nr:PucR family transcriptional regulator [Isobaculum melis]